MNNFQHIAFREITLFILRRKMVALKKNKCFIYCHRHNNNMKKIQSSAPYYLLEYISNYDLSIRN